MTDFRPCVANDIFDLVSHGKISLLTEAIQS